MLPEYEGAICLTVIKRRESVKEAEERERRRILRRPLKDQFQRLQMTVVRLLTMEETKWGYGKAFGLGFG